VLSDLTLRYANLLRWDLFPVNGRKFPKVHRWPEVATSNTGTLEDWVRQRPFRQWGFALPPEIVVVDVDMHVGENGIADFIRLDGHDPRDVPTPTATTWRGGFHLLYVCPGLRYKNGRVAGAAICIKSHVGFIVLPETYPDGSTNGREWLKAPWDVPMMPAPQWLSSRLRQEPVAIGEAAPLSDDLSVRGQGRAALARECARIVGAPAGERDNIRHRACFTVGGLVARGDVDEREAYDALLAACQQVPLTSGRPWHRLEERVEKSLAAGMEQPLPLSNPDRLMRNLRARMRAQRPSP
jgi:hypothetical protein